MKSGKKQLLLIHYEPDQCRVALVNKRGETYKDAVQYTKTPSPFGTDFDPLESIYNVRSAINQLLLKSKELSPVIEGISITTNNNGLVVWEKDSGLPLQKGLRLDSFENPLLFQQLKSDRIDEPVKEKTGLSLSKSLPGVCYRHLLTQNPHYQLGLKQGKVCMGMLETWLLYNLTGRASYKSDFTHAASTGFFDIHQTKWDSFLCQEFLIPPKSLPAVQSSHESFGETRGFVSLPDGLPIVAMCTQAAATYFGHQMTQFGECMLNLDGNGLLVINSGIQPKIMPGHHTDTVMLASQDSPRYGLQLGLHFPKGLLNLLLDPENPHTLFNAVEALTPNVTDPRELYLIPEKNRLNHYTLTGLSGDTERNALLTAYVDTLVFLVKQKLDRLNETFGFSPKEIKVTGQLNQSDAFLQYLSDITQTPVVRLSPNAGLDWGASLIGALSLNWVTKSSPLTKPLKIDRQFVPNLDPISCHAYYSQWLNYCNR